MPAGDRYPTSYPPHGRFFAGAVIPQELSARSTIIARGPGNAFRLAEWQTSP